MSSPGMGLNGLIASSGVSKATFYRHFPSKIECCITSATGGDALVSKRAQQMARWLIEHHRDW